MTISEESAATESARPYSHSSSESDHDHHLRIPNFWKWASRIAILIAILGALYSTWKFVIDPARDLLDSLQNLPQRVSKLETRHTVPLPSPISLGAGVSRVGSYILAVNPGRWIPLPGHDEVAIDWRSMPADLEVYAEATIQVTTSTASRPLYGQIRLFDMTKRDAAFDFDRLQAAVYQTGVPPEVQRIESAPLPRQDTIHTYRLEVSGDSNVQISGYGFLKFRRTAAPGQ